MYVTLRGLISTMASFSNSYLTSRQRLIRSDFRNRALAITLWGKNHPCLSENKETRLLILAFARHDSNATGTVRLPPRAASCRARSMFCRSPVRGGNHFRPPRPSTALSLSRFRRIWIGPDNIAVGTTPRLHRHDIRGRISYIPLFPSFRIHL